MADTPADFVQRQANLCREALAQDAQYLADHATRYAADIIKGGPYGGDASRLAQAALQLALAAARLDEMAQTVTWLKAEAVDHG